MLRTDGENARNDAVVRNDLHGALPVVGGIDATERIDPERAVLVDALDDQGQFVQVGHHADHRGVWRGSLQQADDVAGGVDPGLVAQGLQLPFADRPHLVLLA